MKLWTYAAFLILVLPSGLACKKQSKDRSSDGAREMTIDELFTIGEQRPFGAAGPKFPLSDSYIASARKHAQETLAVAERKLKSDNGTVRCNAYDFLSKLVAVPEVRERAVQLLRAGLNDDGLVRKFVEEELEHLQCD